MAVAIPTDALIVNWVILFFSLTMKSLLNIVEPVPVTPVIFTLLPTDSPWAVLVVTVTIPASVVVIPAVDAIDFASSPKNRIPFPVV